MIASPAMSTTAPAIEAFRAALAALYAASRGAPVNPYLVAAIGHAGAGIAVLEAADSVDILNPNPPDPHRA
jgi:hypothetical protein